MNIPKSIKITRKIDRLEDLPLISKDVLQDHPQTIEKIAVEQITEHDNYFPKSITLESLDQGVIEWVKDWGITIADKLVPAFLFTLERNSEFMQTWTIADNTNFIELPVITIVRDNIPKLGTILGSITANVPTNETFGLYRVPVIKDGKQYYEYVEIPQPTYVDIQYKINLFANSQREMNILDEYLLHLFKNIQIYIDVFGHKMQIKMEDNTDNSKNDLEERRYYHHVYVFTLQGMLLDSKDFRVKSSYNTIKLKTEAISKDFNNGCRISSFVNENATNCKTCYSFTFNKKSPNFIEYNLPSNFHIKYDNLPSNTTIKYYKNNNLVSIPFSVVSTDIIKIEITDPIIKETTIKFCGDDI